MKVGRADADVKRNPFFQKRSFLAKNGTNRELMMSPAGEHAFFPLCAPQPGGRKSAFGLCIDFLAYAPGHSHAKDIQAPAARSGPGGADS
jgi:hypothetical protein